MKFKVNISRIAEKVKKKKQPSMLKQLLDDPDNFKLEAYTEGEEIIIKIKKRES